jgi:hypothetical protein
LGRGKASRAALFKGPPASNSAASFDGVVDIELHWEFDEREEE